MILVSLLGCSTSDPFWTWVEGIYFVWTDLLWLLLNIFPPSDVQLIFWPKVRTLILSNKFVLVEPCLPFLGKRRITGGCAEEGVWMWGLVKDVTWNDGRHNTEHYIQYIYIQNITEIDEYVCTCTETCVLDGSWWFVQWIQPELSRSFQDERRGKVAMRFVPKALRDYFLARCFTRCLLEMNCIINNCMCIYNYIYNIYIYIIYIYMYRIYIYI